MESKHREKKRRETTDGAPLPCFFVLHSYHFRTRPCTPPPNFSPLKTNFQSHPVCICTRAIHLLGPDIQAPAPRGPSTIANLPLPLRQRRRRQRVRACIRIGGVGIPPPAVGLALLHQHPLVGFGGSGNGQLNVVLLLLVLLLCKSSECE